MAYTYTNDDGSTYTIQDDGSTTATQSPPGALVSDYYRNFEPQNITPGATNVSDILKYGIGRLADLANTSLATQNTPPQYQNGAPQRTLVSVPAQVDTRMLILLGGAALLFVLLSGNGKA